MSTAADLPVLFDHTRLRNHRRRALKQAQTFRDALFLRSQTIADLVDRLALVQRPFNKVLELDSPDSGFADQLALMRPDSDIGRSTAYADAQIDRPVTEEGTPLSQSRHIYDLIVSALSLHFANDLPGVLIQIRQALKPDGLFLGALLGSDTLYELRSCLLRAESEITGGAAPRIAPFAQVRDLGALLQRAGFALPVADQDTITVRYHNPLKLLDDLRAMGAANCLVDSTRPLRRDVLMRAMALYVQDFAEPDGKVPATFQVISLSGWAPHNSQQKPLKPGSAKMRLAEALGTAEHKAGDKAGSGES